MVRKVKPAQPPVKVERDPSLGKAHLWAGVLELRCCGYTHDQILAYVKDRLRYSVERK